MQERQVQRGVVVIEGAASGSCLVVALMARALRCGGALRLWACLLRGARRRSNGEQSAAVRESFFKLAGAPGLSLCYGLQELTPRLLLSCQVARCARCATANSRCFAESCQLARTLGRDVRETAHVSLAPNAYNARGQIVVGRLAVRFAGCSRAAAAAVGG